MSRDWRSGLQARLRELQADVSLVKGVADQAAEDIVALQGAPASGVEIVTEDGLAIAHAETVIDEDGPAVAIEAGVSDGGDPAARVITSKVALQGDGGDGGTVNINVRDAAQTRTATIALEDGQIDLTGYDSGTGKNPRLSINGISGDFVLTGLPTANPNVAGALWVDAAAGFVLKVSQG